MKQHCLSKVNRLLSSVLSSTVVALLLAQSNLLVFLGLNGGSNHNNYWAANAAIRSSITNDKSSSTTRPAVLPSRPTTSFDDEDDEATFYLMESNIALVHNIDDDDNGYLKHSRPHERYLRDGEGGLLTTKTFPECIQQKLSPKECQEYIEQQIEDAGGHEVGDDIQVKIRTPRTPEQFAASYWMIEVPTDVYGVVACDYNNGATYYPFKWKDEVTGEELTVRDQHCYGYFGAYCCLKLREYGKQLTQTGYDVNKQCLSCFLHREPLQPIKNETTGNIDFLGYDSTYTDGCIQEQLTSDELDALDEDTLFNIESAIYILEMFEQDRSCHNFEELLQRLYGAAYVIHPLSMKIGQFACSICYGIHDLNLDDIVVSNLIDEMLLLMKQHLKNPKSSKEKCIIIHTSSEGEIVQDPTFGSGRSNSISSSTEDFAPCSYPCAGDTYCGRVLGKYECIPNACVQDPTICSENEFCSPQYQDYYDYLIDNGWRPGDYYPKTDPFYECVPNPCVISPPEECQRGTQTCKPLAQDPEFAIKYVCVGANCEEDPSVCADDEYCGYLPGAEIKYQCRPITCNFDPTLCSEDEWCDEFDYELYYGYREDKSECKENVCITNPPEDCQGENQVCVPRDGYGKKYICM